MTKLRTRPTIRLAGGLLSALLLAFATSCGTGGGGGGPTPPSDGVSVQVSVTGPGRVVQAGFTCDGDCAWAVTPDQPVAFSAEPAAGNVLVAWGGVCPLFEETCTRRFAEGDTIEAVFAPHALRLDVDGDGQGRFRVAGGDVETTCDGACGVALDRSLQLAVTYQADGATGTVLDAWTGACSAATRDDYCLVTVSDVTTVGKIWRTPPVANPDGYAAFRNGTLSVPAGDGVLANDTDTAGDALSASLVDDVANGALTLRPDGGFDYEPVEGFDGQDGFRYQVADAYGNTAEATVTIAVVDRIPAAAADSYVTSRNATLTVDPPGVLDNDADPDGDPLVAVLEDDVVNGTLSLDPDGGFTYEPGPTYVPTDSFTYRASDGVDAGNAATVTISITNDPPEATADTYTTALNAELTVPATGGVLDDDTDADGDALTATLVDDVANGTLTLAPDGSFSYLPDAGFVGTDGFTYVASDGVAESSATTVTIEVTNDGPTATDDAYTVVHDTALTVAAPGVLDGDADPNGDPLTATLATGVTDGTLALAADGSFTYTPDPGFVGSDGFTYAATDGAATSAPASVTITVTNAAPVGISDAYGVAEDGTLSVNAANGVLDNDTDGDGDTLTATLVDDVTNGTLTLDADGSFAYEPDPGVAVTDGFTYQASDGIATSAVTSVTISVSSESPTASGDSYGVLHDATLTVGAADGVLDNDSDPNGDPLQAILVTDVTNGALTLSANGGFTYTPDAGFVGTDGFVYEATDGTYTSETATVSITVTNQTPSASGDAYSVVHDRPLSVNAANGVLDDDTDPDGDALTATLVSDVDDGTLALTADGSFTYTPDPGFVGTDGFTYAATDGAATSAPASVTITVTNAAPVATADAYAVAEDGTLTVSAGNGVLDDDTDPDGDALTATLVSDVGDGTLALAADGSFTYTPDAGFTGTDGFTYQASDGIATSATTTVTITVNPESPTANDDSYDVLHDTTLTVGAADGVLNDDTDPNGDPLQATLAADVTNGTLTLNADGGFTYTPAPGFVGTDGFVYEATDGTYTSATATVTLAVTNQAPTAVADAYQVAHDTVLNVAAPGVLDDDGDPDGETVTADLVTNVTDGTLTLDADGGFTYAPDPGFVGADGFSYRASDGVAFSSTVAVSIDVTNEAPSTSPDTYVADQDTTLNVSAANGVLDNDTDGDGDALTVALDGDVSQGTLILDADGSFTYTPNAGYTGPDSFTYTATDGIATSAATTVSLTVQ